MMETVDEAYQIFLNDVYQGIEPTHYKQADELDHAQVCPTYGELYYSSLMKVLSYLKATKDDVFLDLGSGLGKLALSVYLRTPMLKVIAVEAVPEYHQQALTAFQNAKEAVPALFTKGSLDLICGNFLDMDFNQATIVYSCSTCFSQELLWLMGEKLNQAHNVTQILSLKPMANLHRLPLKKVISVECSWDSALCYWYGK